MGVIKDQIVREEDEWMYRSDQEAIEQALAKFHRWADHGSSVFTQDDYDILFQAGAFEWHDLAEKFMDAVYRLGPVPGERKSDLTGEDVSPRKQITGRPDLRGSQRIVYGGNRG